MDHGEHQATAEAIVEVARALASRDEAELLGKRWHVAEVGAQGLGERVPSALGGGGRVAEPEAARDVFGEAALLHVGACRFTAWIVEKPRPRVLVDVASAESLARAMAEFLRGRVSFDAANIRRSVVERFGADAFLRNITSVYDAVR